MPTPTPLQVKAEIILISGLTADPQNLKGTTKLAELNYNGYMCTNLENRLRDMTDKQIPPGSVTASRTVTQIIALAI